MREFLGLYPQGWHGQNLQFAALKQTVLGCVAKPPSLQECTIRFGGEAKKFTPDEVMLVMDKLVQIGQQPG